MRADSAVCGYKWLISCENSASAGVAIFQRITLRLGDAVQFLMSPGILFYLSPDNNQTLLGG
jgi:hypothetical protein